MKRKGLRQIRQKTAAILTAAILAGGISTASASPVMASEPNVSVDETIYVNLDYYGRQTKVNVVKGVTTNGLSHYTDYGTYNKIINMSSNVQPQQSTGQLDWDLTGQGSRFYYQGTMDASHVELPWTFDIGYKLNGREVEAQALSGASGLVEIHVLAQPNEKAEEYYRSNMLLSVMIPVDMQKCYSVDAPGSQTQSMGGTTGVVFTALPGEKGDFTARIGTESYESIGVVMMMIPGTTSSLEHVKDIKEAKDTWRQEGSDLYDSMDGMMASVESMKSGIQTVQRSLTSLENARRAVSANRPGIEAQNDVSIEALSALAQQSMAMVPYLQTAKASAEDIHTNMGEIVSTLEGMQAPIRNLDEELDTVQNGMSRMEDVLPSLESSLNQVITLDTQLQAQQAAVSMAIMGLSQTSMEGDIDDNADSYADEQATSYADSMMAAAGLDLNDPGQAALYHKQWQAIYDQAFQKYYQGYKENAMGQLQSAVSGIESPKDNLLKKVDALETLASHSNALSRSAQTTLRGLNRSADELRDILTDSDELIDEIADFHDTMTIYYPILQDALTDSQILANRANNMLNQTVASLTIIQNTLKSSSGYLDEGSRELISGSMELLEKGLDMLDSTGEIRKSSGVMKTTLDEQLDEFENENQFLEIDPDAPMLSFTSSKNPEPHSLQIILRTDEISLDEKEEVILDMETAAAPSNPFARMWQVLVNMWKAAAEVFRKR